MTARPHVQVVVSREDQALVERLRARDAAAFRTLVTSLHGRLLRLARHYVRSDALAEEVVQETWLGVIEGLPGFEGRSTLRSWIFRILLNRAQTRGAREARSAPVSSLASDDEGNEAWLESRFDAAGHWNVFPAAWPAESPEALYGRKDAMEALRAALPLLPERQRAVFMLRDVEGLESEEVCNALDLTETNQRVLLHRARTRLREALERHFS